MAKSRGRSIFSCAPWLSPDPTPYIPDPASPGFPLLDPPCPVDVGEHVLFCLCTLLPDSAPHTRLHPVCPQPTAHHALQVLESRRVLHIMHNRLVAPAHYSLGKSSVRNTHDPSPCPADLGQQVNRRVLHIMHTSCAPCLVYPYNSKTCIPLTFVSPHHALRILVNRRVLHTTDAIIRAKPVYVQKMEKIQPTAVRQRRPFRPDTSLQQQGGREGEKGSRLSGCARGSAKRP